MYTKQFTGKEKYNSVSFFAIADIAFGRVVALEFSVSIKGEKYDRYCLLRDGRVVNKYTRKIVNLPVYLMFAVLRGVQSFESCAWIGKEVDAEFDSVHLGEVSLDKSAIAECVENMCAQMFARKG